MSTTAFLYTGFPEFVGHPSVTQHGILRIGGYWRFVPPALISDVFRLQVRYLDLREVEMSLFQRGVARGVDVTTPITFRLVATVMRVVGVAFQFQPVDVTVWSETTVGRTVGFTMPQQVWDLGSDEYLVGLRLEVAGEVVGVPAIRPDNLATASVGHDWIPWRTGMVVLSLAAPSV